MTLRLKFCAAVMSALLATPIAWGATDKKDYTALVNTLQGTHNTNEFSHGRCKSWVTRPHSMNLWTPNNNGFECGTMTISAFTMLGETTSAPVKSEKGMPHLYKKVLVNGMVHEATATDLCGNFRFSFPKKSSPVVVLNSKTENFKAQGKDMFLMTDKNRYAVVKFSVAPKEVGSTSNGQFYARFSSGAKVEVQIATSRVSIEQALTTFNREVAGKNFNQVCDESQKLWNGILSQIEVEGGTEEQQRTFYTCLWRANIFPLDVTEVANDGKERFFHAGQVYDGLNFIHPTYWDNARCHLPLLMILHPSVMERYMQSLDRCYELDGWLPDGMIGNHGSVVFADAWAKGIRTFDPQKALKAYYHEVTNCEPHPLKGYFAEHERGRGRFGYADYFALGYIPSELGSKRVRERTSRTMEYAYDDYCAYQLAKYVGNDFYANVFKEQMYNYRNIIDPTDHFPKGRDAEGNWEKDFNPYEWGGPFVEGNAYHYKWSVFHDVQGLINLVGGKKQFVKELNDVLEAKGDSIMPGGYGEVIHEINEVVAGGMGQYAPGNEPTFHFLYLYSYAGEPWRTQELIRHSLKTHFNPGVDGFMGDDDAGSMSSFYVLSSMGFYSVTPGVAQYVLGSPLFNKVTIHLENGKDFVIEAPENTDKNVYVNRVTINGSEWNHNFLRHEALMAGGNMHFEMSAEPNKERGTRGADVPFSVTLGNY